MRVGISRLTTGMRAEASLRNGGKETGRMGEHPAGYQDQRCRSGGISGPRDEFGSVGLEFRDSEDKRFIARRRELLGELVLIYVYVSWSRNSSPLSRACVVHASGVVHVSSLPEIQWCVPATGPNLA